MTIPTARGTTCYSRVVFLVDLRTNQVARQQIVKMIVVSATGDIVTAYPTGRHC